LDPKHRSPPADPAALLPEGRRWGRGADSLVPYLAQSLRTRPAPSNPVFNDMADWLRRTCAASSTRVLR
jgi:hypothetical protein